MSDITLDIKAALNVNPPGALAEPHASTHGVAGSDPLTPAAIGAASATALANEATTRELADTTLTDDLAAEVSTRTAAIAAAEARVDSLLDGIYDIDAMPAVYTAWLAAGSLTDTDGRRIQWAVNRLTLSDDGLTSVRRNVKLLFGTREYDISDMPLQETGILGTYGPGATRYGANTQILIPPTGATSTNRWVTLTFEAKVQSTYGYSVVNGDPSNVMPTSAVVKSSLAGMGDASMIGASRSQSAYAGLYMTGVTVRFEGVTFRVTGGITAFDASHALTIQGDRFIADTGTPSHQLPDPRRKADGSWFVEGVTADNEECEFRKRQFGLRTPMLWNGGELNVNQISVVGFRYGFDANEHLRVDYVFANYCFAAVKLRVMSHTAFIDMLKVQRCPIGIEGPDVGDWNGWEDTALFICRHFGGEAYHDGVNGNPPGARWFSHRARFTDPSNLWYGWAEYYASPGEAHPTYLTIAAGTGTNVQIRQMTDPLGGGGGAVDSVNGDTGTVVVDVTPTVRGLTIVAGVTTITPPNHIKADRAKLIVNANTALTFAGWQDGDEGEYIIAQSGASHAVTWGAAPDGFVLASEGTLASFGNTDDHVDLLKVRCRDTLIIREVVSLGTIAGYTFEGGGAGFTLPTLNTMTALWMVDPSVDVFDSATGGNEVTGTNNASIGRIMDAIAGTMSFAQATAGAKPTLKTNVINGKPAIEFDGGDYLTSALAAAQSRPYTMFLVAKVVDANTAASERTFVSIVQDGARIQQRSPTSGSTNFRWKYYGSNCSSADKAQGSFYYVTGIDTANGGGQATIRVNGVQEAQDWISGGNLASGAAIGIGADCNGLGRFVAAGSQIALVIFCAGNDATDIAAIEGAIQTYFGL